MSNLILNLKWAWQAHFWSHRPVTLQNCTFSEYVQMILLALFKISYNKKFEKNPKAFMSISVACPCPSIQPVKVPKYWACLNKNNCSYMPFNWTKIGNQQEYEKVIVISFEDLQKLY